MVQDVQALLWLSDGQTKDLITLEQGSYSDINVELSKEPKDRFLVLSYINVVNKIERQEYYNIDKIERIDASLELWGMSIHTLDGVLE